MRLTYFLIIGVTCISCNSRSNKTRVESMDDTARKVTDVNKVISINPLKITGADLSSLKYKGKLQEAWKWNDNLGENIFFTTYVAPYADSGKSQFDEEGQTSELHAFHYSKKGDSYTPVWTFSDGVQACEFDITSNFIPGSTTITDLDNDGIAEIKIQYLTACRSDVSPAAMKLVLYEN